MSTMIIVGCYMLLISDVHALTSLEAKGVTTVRSASVDTTPPHRARTLKSTDITQWLSLLPKESDRHYQEYVVIPGLGIIVPVIYTQTNDPRYQDFVKGHNLNVNEFLKKGIHHYPGTPMPGSPGNAVIGGHSNFYKNQATDFTTIFAQLPMLDVSDEIWYYTHMNDGLWMRYVYQVARSYETTPNDQGVFSSLSQGSEITLYTCVPIGTSDNRRIIKAQLIYSHLQDHSLSTNNKSQLTQTILQANQPKPSLIVQVPAIKQHIGSENHSTSGSNHLVTPDISIPTPDTRSGSILPREQQVSGDIQLSLNSGQLMSGIIQPSDLIETSILLPKLDEPLTWRQQMWRWMQGRFI